LEQDETHADDIPVRSPRMSSPQMSEGLTADQIALLCEVEEWEVDKLTQDKRRDVDRLLSKGYIERTDASLGPHLKLTKKGTDFLSERGVGPNEA
jgi:CTP-dependent riboflavin kinase